MSKIGKTFTLFLNVLVIMSCLTLLTSKPANAQNPSPTPLLTPSTIAPSENYSIPPLTSLKLNRYLIFGEVCGGSVNIKGGSGNDINFRVIDPQGKVILDLGRISNEKAFQFFANKPSGNFTFIFDNEFSVLSSKEVKVFSNTYPENLFEFAGFSINLLAIILVIISVVALLTLGVLLKRRKK
jgi:hypothetical protein